MNGGSSFPLVTSTVWSPLYLATCGDLLNKRLTWKSRLPQVDFYFRFQNLLFMDINYLFFVYMYIAILPTVNILLFYSLTLILLSGDIQPNPGPIRPANGRCEILFSNIYGLHGNIRDLAVSSRNCDVVLCAETLVSNRRHLCELELPGFSKPQLLLKEAPGITHGVARGLAIYIRDGYAAFRKQSYECGCHEFMVVRICSNNHNFYVLNVYRNHRDTNDTIYDCLIRAMSDIQGSDPKAAFVLVGDFNAPHIDWLGLTADTDCRSRAALDFSILTGCTQLVNGPTHRAGNCLDLVFTDVPDLVSVNVVSPVGGSDHSTLKLSLLIRQKMVATSYRRQIYLKHNVNWDRISSKVSSLSWGEVFRDPNPIDLLNSKISDIIKQHIPVKNLTIRSGDKPWFNAECRRANCDKQTAYHRWSRNRTHDNWLLFVEKRSASEQVYRVAERDYNVRLKENLENVRQPHKWWSSLKSAVFGSNSNIPPLLSPGGSLVTDPKAKAELLLAHFNGKQSAKILTLPSTCDPIVSFSAFAFRSKEVLSILQGLDEYGGTDPLGHFPLFFKKVATALAPKLSVIFRFLIRKGSFPACWRTANVTPVPKGAATPNPSNYRPISITPILSKVYEKLLSSRLTNYLERRNWFPPTQFAYRKGLGTCDALLSISHLIQSALDAGSEARVVQIDFSAAFDRVNHAGLIFKLKDIGIGGSFLSIISEFLCSRTQRVCVEGCFSPYSAVASGVPQGSVLGPILFLIYVAEVYSLVSNYLFGYADDKTLMSIIPSPADRANCAESLNADLAKLHKFCSTWDMLINCGKTQSLIFSRSRTKYPLHPTLVLNDSVLSESSNLKVLGVILDSKMTFADHLRSLSSIASQKLGILRRANKVFQDFSINATCLRSFVLPVLEYCAPVWCSAAHSHLDLLDRVIRGASSLVDGTLCVSLEHRRAVSSLCMLFRIRGNPNHFLHGFLPGLRSCRRDTRASFRSHVLSMTEPRCRTLQYSRTFLPSTVRLWNSLTDDVFDGVDSVSLFKSRCNRALN